MYDEMVNRQNHIWKFICVILKTFTYNTHTSWCNNVIVSRFSSSISQTEIVCMKCQQLFPRTQNIKFK